MLDFNDPNRHFDGSRLKQLLAAYALVDGDGKILLKVRTFRRGQCTETWFKAEQKMGDFGKIQIPLSNSLRSTLFQFELVPLDGKPAKFRAVEVVPLFLTRAV